ncbi:S1 family peptidase [Streptomyces sp. NPDC057654]|uniref:S1 family peptidase n=1 Tax=Streptomyces sp. NPDC057654 TaxID=3346196 RepID=UPI0036838792
MSGRCSRAAWIAGILTTSVTISLLAGTSAQAVVGDEDGASTFTAKLEIGDSQRNCSGALVEQQWVITAASCFADAPGSKVTTGAPKQKTTVTVGRTDLTSKAGSVVNAVELVPREDRDLVMVKLAKPVTGVTPLAVGTDAPQPGEHLRVAGFGRTKTEWVPNSLHSGAFTVGATDGSTLGLNGKSATDVICKGDAGGPAFREKNGHLELAAVNSLSWQKGCIGNEDETREGASEARVDDIAGWIQAVASRTLLDRANWQNAAYLASGHFTSPADGQRRMDLFVVWKDGSATLYQGADHDDPKQPFSTTHQIAAAGSFWTRAQAITGGTFAPDGRDGVTVRWSNGKLSTFTHLDQNGVHDEQVLREPGGDNPFWKNARLITAGRYTDNPLRDDLLVLWDNGSVSMYAHTSTQGLKGWTQLHDAGKDAWTEAAQLSAGEFTGKKTDDLVIRWKDGDTTIFPGVDTNGFHGRTRIRPVGSPWKNAEILTVGSFTTPTARPDDILIRWANGNLGYYPHVDANGTHDAIPLVNRPN